MPEQPPANSEPIHQDVDFETSDARLSLLGWTGLGLVALILFGVFVSLIVFNIFSGIMDASDPGLSPVAAKDRPRLPRDIDKIPQPRLQNFNQSDVLDMRQLRDKEEARLDKTGWVDPAKGTVHLKIEDAMRLMANPDFAKDHGIRVAPAKAQGGGRP
jgi:hypothetical protein